MEPLAILDSLLTAWLQSSDSAARAAAIAAHGPELDAAAAQGLLELATAGPGYGGDAADKRRLQLDLLSLARAVAVQVEAWSEAARASAGLAAEAASSRDFKAAGSHAADWRTAAQKAGEREQMAKASQWLGLLYGELGRFAEADRCLADAAAIYAEDLDEPALALTLIGRLEVASLGDDLQAIASRAADIAAFRVRTRDAEAIETLDAAWPSWLPPLPDDG